MTPRLLVPLTVLTLGLSGCGEALPRAGTTSAQLLCHDQRVDREALEAAPPASELGADGRAALQGYEVPDIGDPANWTVLEESADEVVLIRELAEAQDNDGGVLYTHELLAVEDIGTGNPGGIDGWHMRSSGRCNLRTDLGRLGAADVALDPSALPGEEATSVALLVTERECASGERATGRIEVLETSPTESEVRVVIGVSPVSGVATCQGNPATPFTLELEQPLGSRTLVDASVHPPRPITVVAQE
jgi:hypothetical protein